MVGVLLGDVFPDIEADTTIGKIQLHKWIGDSWAILFSHPRDFTPVCTTELARVVNLADEFKKRDVKLIALSCDSVDDHRTWTKDILAYCGAGDVPFPYPIIADPTRDIGTKLGMIDPDEKDSQGIPLTARAVFVIGPDKRLKLSILYPATTGRNFHEILRAVDSLQLTAKQRVATPVDWKVGERCIVQPSVTNEEAAKLFPTGIEQVALPSGKQYMRFVSNSKAT